MRLSSALPDIGVRKRDRRERLARRLEQDESDAAVLHLLVAGECLPGSLRVHFGARRLEQLLDIPRLVIEPGQPERSDQPKRHRFAVRQQVVRGGFERVRERVAKVEHPAFSQIPRVAQTHRRLECRAAPNELGLRQLPQLLTRQKTCLHDLGHAVPPLALGQRREQRRVDHRAPRPMKGAHEVLAFRQVDACLAADRGIHLTHERRRHRDPVNAAKVCRRDEAADIRRRAAADGDERPAPLEAERTPQTVAVRDRLGLDRMRRAVERRGMKLEHGGVHDHFDRTATVQHSVRTSRDVDPPLRRARRRRHLEQRHLLAPRIPAFAARRGRGTPTRPGREAVRCRGRGTRRCPRPRPRERSVPARAMRLASVRT